MSESADPTPLQRAADRAEQGPFRHHLNERCEMYGTALGDRAGLQRLGVHLVRIPPGREANIVHTHTAEEEFYFILSGRGVALLDGVEHEVGPGDFIGLPTPSIPHQIRNPGGDDLVYLVGGERKSLEIAEFPNEAKRLIRIGREAWLVDEHDLKPVRRP